MTAAVRLQTAPKTPSPSPAIPVLQKTANKRWPPMANRSALPYKLTVISKEKLAREATAPDPDLRRCVAHFRLHCGSVEWTEKDMKSRISSFEFEDTDSEDEKDECDQTVAAAKIEFTEIKLNTPPSCGPTIETVEIEVEVETVSPAASSSPPPSPHLSPDNGLLDKSRNCLEATSKHFWPSGGACISVSPIVG